jgi:hypothetical protein
VWQQNATGSLISVKPEPAPDPKRIKIEAAVKSFFFDANSRGLKKHTQQKLRNLYCRLILGWVNHEMAGQTAH